MDILIATNSFKGSLDAEEVAFYIEKGIKNANPKIKVTRVPVSDGGDGLLNRLVSATNGRKIEVEVRGPTGNKIQTCYGVLGDKKTAVIESALVCGYSFMQKEKIDPTKTTTYGVGELIKKIAKEGYNKPHPK
jgi:glycerate kinase